jgi:hypothetical protein
LSCFGRELAEHDDLRVRALLLGDHGPDRVRIFRGYDGVGGVVSVLATELELAELFGLVEIA